MIINTEDYMNIANFARYTGKTAVWINLLIKSGNLPYILISGVKFINYKEYGEKVNKGKNKHEGSEGKERVCSCKNKD